jgi:hypothetical protein
MQLWTTPKPGDVFNGWTFLAPGPRIGNRMAWLCRCPCGHERNKAVYEILVRQTKSCRSCRPQQPKSPRRRATGGRSAQTSHGMAYTRLYRTWAAIKSRCKSDSPTTYPYYKALGVTVADEWLQDFPAFAAHVGEPPTPEHTLDRIDPWGNYEPGNVRWATRKEQIRNRRRSEDGKLIRHSVK